MWPSRWRVPKTACACSSCTGRHAAAGGQLPQAGGAQGGAGRARARRRILIDHADGFLGLKALLPPPSRRALVLIDPPYEVKLDYKHVRDALDDALGRFPSGIYAVWYPVLQRMESRQFADRLKRLPAKEWLHVTLTVATPGPDGTGLHSSGMFILNPPYTLEATLRETMPYLVQVLGQDSGATFRIEKGTQVTGTGHAGARRRCRPAQAGRQCAPRQPAVRRRQPAPAGPALRRGPAQARGCGSGTAAKAPRPKPGTQPSGARRRKNASLASAMPTRQSRRHRRHAAPNASRRRRLSPPSSVVFPFSP
jgi:23S rRNA (adenine2030-N6)-methyltransferase